jgi:transposase
MRYELTDYEWADIKPFLPNKRRGVPRVNEVGPLDDLHEDFSTSREVTYSSQRVFVGIVQSSIGGGVLPRVLPKGVGTSG